jgi:hypothetical protein
LLFNIVEKGCSRTFEAINDHTFMIPLTVLFSQDNQDLLSNEVVKKRPSDLYHDRARQFYKDTVCSYDQLHNRLSPVNSSGTGELVTGPIISYQTAEEVTWNYLCTYA